MPADEKPVGQLYSQVYLKRGKPEDDNPRFRRRLAAYCENFSDFLRPRIERMIDLQMGVEISLRTFSNLIYFFERADLADVLDAITVVWKGGSRGLTSDPTPDQWLSFVRSVFKEENLAYTLDDRGGVHPLVDEEFQTSKWAVVAALQDARYAAVRAEFEKAYRFLDPSGRTAKEAVRAMFEATEIMAKLVADRSIARLGASELEGVIGRKIDAAYAADPVAQRAARQLLEGFSKWVVAAQQYRHGQTSPEPSNPPLDMAILFISQGAAYLRWLADIAARAQPSLQSGEPQAAGD